MTQAPRDMEERARRMRAFADKVSKERLPDGVQAWNAREAPEPAAAGPRPDASDDDLFDAIDALVAEAEASEPVQATAPPSPAAVAKAAPSGAPATRAPVNGASAPPGNRPSIVAGPPGPAGAPATATSPPPAAPAQDAARVGKLLRAAASAGAQGSRAPAGLAPASGAQPNVAPAEPEVVKPGARRLPAPLPEGEVEIKMDKVGRAGAPDLSTVDFDVKPDGRKGMRIDDLLPPAADVKMDGRRAGRFDDLLPPDADVRMDGRKGMRVDDLVPPEADVAMDSPAGGRPHAHVGRAGEEE